jgi:hypothetical protein
MPTRPPTVIRYARGFRVESAAGYQLAITDPGFGIRPTRLVLVPRGAPVPALTGKLAGANPIAVLVRSVAVWLNEDAALLHLLGVADRITITGPRAHYPELQAGIASAGIGTPAPSCRGRCPPKIFFQPLRRVLGVEYPDKCHALRLIQSQPVAVEFRPYEFHSAGEQPPSSDHSSLLYPSSVENACWESYISLALSADTSEDWDVEYVPIRNRCEHLIIPYPTGGVLVKMRLLQLNDTCVTLLFEHYPDKSDETIPCIRTVKTIACVRRFQARSLPTEWPRPVRHQLNGMEIAHGGVAGARRLGLLHRIRSFFTFPHNAG